MAVPPQTPSYIPPPPPPPIQPVPQPQPLPTARPPQFGPPPQVVPKEETTPTFVSNKLLVVFVFLGMVILTLGAMMIHAAPEITNKDYKDLTSDQYKSDLRFQQTVSSVGHIFADIGALFLVTFLLLAAVLRTDWSDTIRFGLFIAVGLFLLGFAFTI